MLDNWLSYFIKDRGFVLYRGLEMAQHGRMLTSIAQYLLPSPACLPACLPAACTNRFMYADRALHWNMNHTAVLVPLAVSAHHEIVRLYSLCAASGQTQGTTNTPATPSC